MIIEQTADFVSAVLAAGEVKLFVLLVFVTAVGGVAAVFLGVQIYRGNVDPAEDIDLPFLEGRLTNWWAMLACAAAAAAGGASLFFMVNSAGGDGPPVRDRVDVRLTARSPGADKDRLELFFSEIGIIGLCDGRKVFDASNRDLAEFVRDSAETIPGGAGRYRSEFGPDVWTMSIRENDGSGLRTTEFVFAPDSSLPEPPPAAARIMDRLLKVSARLRAVPKEPAP